MKTVPLSKKEIADLESVLCSNCGGEIFGQGVKFKTLPSVHPVNDTGKAQIINVPATVCALCKSELNDN